MSIQLISQYYSILDKTVQYGGSSKETAVRNAFYNLLNQYCERKDLLLIPELDYLTPTNKRVRPDGTVKDALRLDWGYWESKDTSDKLEDEIAKKFRLGYPDTNILFEDTQHAILFQQGQRIGSVPIREANQLDKLLTTFVSFERAEIRSFRQAIEQFKLDIPFVLKELRKLIDRQGGENLAFQQIRKGFWKLCREVINPLVTLEDTNEMLIQHILTEEIFTSIFDDSQFHRENNVARELMKMEETFFTGSIKRNTMDTIKQYYHIINAQARAIASHHEKQKFLKVIYESFYKAYNPKAADKLGIVYTPSEIVEFMIESTDHLLFKHFSRLLADQNVEILDPATGTGTFMTDLIEYLPKDRLAYKYKHELHCNEVSILPYYIANLNIEATFRQKMGYYEEFKNICFADTLDNTSALGYKGKQKEMFGFSAENAERIKAQNTRKISVIIGNPPYNAKQENYNQDNANRAYKEIDKRIKDTYIKYGRAQNQNGLYDMYVRFFRWASDRIDKNGVLAFVTNNSFINSQSFDGFRKLAAEEFNEIYIVDLKGNARSSGERRKQEGGNIFSDQIRVGVAVYFMIKNQSTDGCKIYYNAVQDYKSDQDKKDYLKENSLKNLSFQHIIPDKKYNWINLSENDYDTLLPLIDKDVKEGKGEKALFKLFTRGIGTYRDEWVYDLSIEKLEHRMRFFVQEYQKEIEKAKKKIVSERNTAIKWDSELDSYVQRRIEKRFDEENITKSLYRPFFKEYLYYDKHFNGRTYQWGDIYSPIYQNISIAFSALANNKPFHCLGTNLIADLHLTGDSQCLPLYRFDKSGKRIDNITEWGLVQFQQEYGGNITKEDIFHYVYAVLHNPGYRQKYDLNLKRDFPRVPFYEDFLKWSTWGKQLIDLHINYETVTPYELERVEANKGKAVIVQENLLTNSDLQKGISIPQAIFKKSTINVKLKACKEEGVIELDEHTSLKGIPTEAWEYKLGNRSALEWVLDQYKEKKPSDPTIAAHFNNYHFSEYKEQVIDLLKRVCTVSVETMKIIHQM